MFTDGTQEIVDRVDSVRVSNGVLILGNRRSISYDTEHKGSYPLANIKKWTAEENW